MTIAPMLVVAAIDGYVTRDGTAQPKGTAFDRIITSPADYAPPPGCDLIPDDGRPLYVQNSGKPPGPPEGDPAPEYINDADAIAQGAKNNSWYIIKGSGYATQLKIPS